MSAGALPFWKRGSFALLLVWGLSAAYVFPFRNRGWVPHDEGVLGESAERILQGQLPHRDFGDVYTGGLSFLHALVFRAFGPGIRPLRGFLFVWFLLFLPVVYAVARRFAGPGASAAICLLSVVWSVVNHFSSMPSWYILFLSVFQLWMLLHHAETSRRRWLFLGGLAAGVSIALKLHGFFTMAAGLMAIVFREERLAVAASGHAGNGRSAFLRWKAAGASLLTVLLLALIRTQLHPMEFIHFVLPGSALCAFLVWSEARSAPGMPALERFKRLSRLLAPYLAGAFVPLVLLAVPYLLVGGLADLLSGVFLKSPRRFQHSFFHLPPLKAFLPALPYGLLLAFPPALRSRRAGLALATALGAALGLALYAGDSSALYPVIWQSARSLGVVAVLAACAALVRAAGSASPTSRDPVPFLALVATLAMTSLVQFPFAAPVYFCYTAPLVALTLLALVARAPRGVKPLHGVVFAFYLGFGLLWMNGGYIYGLGRSWLPYRPLREMRLERSGIRVPEGQAAEYEALVSIVRREEAGKPIYAAPDCPEVYFLSASPNPTRVLIDFFEDASDASALLRMLESADVRVVVINSRPDFSRPLAYRVRMALAAAYPRSAEFGRFLVRWRAPTPSADTR